ncbi:acyl-CoA dehydrogenase family protein [Catenuloplanes indicus]|uniref:Alkylation response protein AidB-like acyl-CoA dehydrogenase n=1 Tax=Catenuloplanes indicus TaxID=137267 RepID=A0AAE3W822_9ACTN|nr:acyl-CoA dehydrogenase family protein [Catenuloplanes indicus]MDQ0371186.1 alkylation response protein AidB-like acyl-CoA dehydrogenase [Catenuloplanes indicus]
MSGLLTGIRRGTLDWDLLRPFPAPDPAELAAADDAATDLTVLLDGLLDPDDADLTRTLPPQLVPSLAAKGFLRLTLPELDGGLGLGPFGMFRTLAAASGRSAAVGLLLAVHNALSLPAYLPVLPPGPLRDLVLARLADGTVFGVADTEPAGAANTARNTVAVPTADGRGYLLTGEKTFIGNGRIAGLLAVTATVLDTGPERVDLFVVDTAAEGFSVAAAHDFLGLAGAPSAALRLDGVFVPAHRVLVTTDGGWRSSPAVTGINALARMCITVAPAAAIARSCVGWTRDFLGRRAIDGRPLAGYEAVRRRAAASAAELFALDSVVRWCLLGPGDRTPEMVSAKNIGTVLAWRVAERTMSLFGAEGYETATSKARRGVPPVPLERALRDVRGLRIAGGVDFSVDLRSARGAILPPYRSGELPPPGRPAAAAHPPGSALAPAARYLDRQAHEFAVRCARLTRDSTASELVERQDTLITLSRLADELFTMAVVLGRAGGPAETALAETYCAHARNRTAALCRVLDTPADDAHDRLGRAWLAGDLDHLLM